VPIELSYKAAAWSTRMEAVITLFQ